MRLHPQQFRWRKALTALALAAVAAPGCGGSGIDLVPVKGKVLLNGQPLTLGSIITLPPAGRGTFAPIQPDGTFELTSGRESGALVGTHRVAIIAVEGEVAQGAEAPASKGKSLVPERYSNPATSNLTIEVTADGENEPVLELTSP